jgi:PleD family two-component response regulator
MHPRDGATPDDLIRVADQRMYEAKRTGTARAA